MADQDVPKSGHWPVDPQEDVVVDKDRIWIDGCFDFSHHGMLRHSLSLTSIMVAVQDLSCCVRSCRRYAASKTAGKRTTGWCSFG